MAAFCDPRCRSPLSIDMARVDVRISRTVAVAPMKKTLLLRYVRLFTYQCEVK